MPNPISVAVIGAGPAGLTAAYLLSKQGVHVTVFEADPHYVGGISKTVKRDGFHFDIGGHRFFSKSQRVEDFWTEILPNDMLERPRSSRIYYRRKFFAYPLRAFEALRKLGLLESALCMLSYLKARMWPRRNPVSFEDWVTNQFGARLFRIFFKTYTEKVWGMSCKEISADWAAQRIKGLSLFTAIKDALTIKRSKPRGEVIKTLIDTFRYPRKGPGMMWEACAARVAEQGGRILMGERIVRLVQQDGRWEVSSNRHRVIADHVISSAPIRELAQAIEPPLSFDSARAAGKLSYRDFVTVTLILRGKDLFFDNWIYIHDPSVKVGRIQNFKSWSPEMVASPEYGCYGLEYFCNEGDALWSKPDDELIALARSELAQIGLGGDASFQLGHVIRQAKAYPVYDEHYQANVEKVRLELEKRFPGIHLVGRNGMHKYNNQDHAIMTAMLTVENIVAGKRVYDVWQVNQDAEYHEAGNRGASGLRAVPTKVPDHEQGSRAA